jgi:hypothetical protein
MPYHAHFALVAICVGVACDLGTPAGDGEMTERDAKAVKEADDAEEAKPASCAGGNCKQICGDGAECEKTCAGGGCS